MNIPDKSISWFIVVNPNAGRRKGEKDWSLIEDLLQKNKLSYSAEFTSSKGHAVKLVYNAIGAGYRNIIAVGGDGSQGM